MLNYATVQTIIQSLRVFLDIMVMWILLYYTMKIVRNNSRTIQIFKGIILVLVVRAAAVFFGFRTVAWMADMFVTWGFLAIIIIFQPEIRSLLEKLGKSSVFTKLSTLTGTEKEQLVDELVMAVTQMSEDRIGALITIEQSQSLIDYIRTGSPMNSIVTSDVLRSIFSTSTPIHDGAVIIQGDRISCASAYFPPTNLELPSRYGARHRAALGISEITDSITIVVSEETGRISIAEEGSLIPMTEKKLREYLNKMIIEEEVDIEIRKDRSKRSFFTSKEPVEIVVEDESGMAGASQPEVQKSDPLLKRIFLKRESAKKESKVKEETSTEDDKAIQPQQSTKKKRKRTIIDEKSSSQENSYTEVESKEEPQIEGSSEQITEVSQDTADELLDSLKLEYSEGKEDDKEGGEQK